MVSQPDLTPADWELIVQLLERERRELPAEIHHTMTGDVRDFLHERLLQVNRILETVHSAAGPA